MTSTTTDRPLPKPAIAPPEGREPLREIWPLSKDSIFGKGYRTSVYIHKPPADFSGGKKLPVLYIHGIQSHPSWFFGSALAMAEAGHTVYQVTRRGSGDNTKARGDISNGFEIHMDIKACIKEILRREGVENLHLVGVSWGGKVIAAFAAKTKQCGNSIASVTLLAPGIISRIDVPLSTKVGVSASTWIPSLLEFLFFFPVLVYEPLKSTMSFWLFLSLYITVFVLLVFAGLVLERIRFRIPLNDPELFTNNPAKQEYLRLDEFQLHKVTAQFMYVSRMIDWSLKFAKADSISCPTTLILASDDKIIDNDETERVVRKLAGDRLKIVRLAGSHTLEFEPNPQPFFHEVVQAVARGETVMDAEDI